ncbi:hypothetical protein M9H77_21574 [Catharanthus roseus]|uniref:Uncharacterized protein n=1 Tax=Catharanthus roseus TaxID=4058 RepID=A0ACC0AS11_CATRO|nr:hypothetical protein M9H77_21574 [Catharanthus roseus]
MLNPLVMVNSGDFTTILHHRGVFVMNSRAQDANPISVLRDSCHRTPLRNRIPRAVGDAEFEVENKDNDGIWKDVNVNDLSGLDGRDVIGTETGKSKIDNTEKVEEQDYAETLVENDGAVQEGYESDEEHRLVDEEFQLFEGENIQVSDSDNACCDLESLNEFEGFESDGCEENAGNPNKVVKFRLEIDGENPQFQVDSAICGGKNCKWKIYGAPQLDESFHMRVIQPYTKLWDYVEELRSSDPKDQVRLKTFTDAKVISKVYSPFTDNPAHHQSHS